MNEMRVARLMSMVNVLHCIASIQIVPDYITAYQDCICLIDGYLHCNALTENEAAELKEYADKVFKKYIDTFFNKA